MISLGDVFSGDMEMCFFARDMDFTIASGACIAHPLCKTTKHVHLLHFLISDYSEQAQWAADEGHQVLEDRVSLGEH